MKTTAKIQANFSLPVVFREPIMIKIGNSQKNPIMAKAINTNIAESSILKHFVMHFSKPYYFALKLLPKDNLNEPN